MPRSRDITNELGTFLRQYARRAQKGQNSNDRTYDRGIEKRIRKMKPEELDRLINGEDDDRLPTRISK